MTPGPGDSPCEVEWEVWLARRQPVRALVVLGVILLAAAGALLLFRTALAPVATVMVLAGAVAEFLLPTRYRLAATGAEARNLLFWRRIEWREVKRVYSGKEEIKLSPLPNGGPREAFRGVVLRCERNRELVLETIRKFRDGA